jgi:hypothetical protein
MQVYGLAVDEKSNRSSITIEYEFEAAAGHKSVIHIMESTDRLVNLGDQITLKKTLPAVNLQRGAYELRVKVHDNISRQVFERSTTFTVE